MICINFRSLSMRYLLSVLLLGCAALAPHEAAAQRSPRRDKEFLTASPRIGERLPDVAVVTLDGQPFNTRELRGRYTVLTFGCLT
jgi:cytochrome oxidase Cu insertion factor (SCO1/SenC/PrrC family)